eukprot:403372935
MEEQGDQLKMMQIYIHINNLSSGLVTIGDLGITDCSGNQYQWNDIKLPDATDSAGLYVQVLPSTLQLNLNSANSFTQYGSFSFRITSSGLVTIGDLGITDCSGNQYQWNDIKLPDATDSAGLYVQVLPSTLQLNLNSANSFTQYGSFSFRITSSGLVTIGDLGITDCSGNQYQWNDIKLPDATDSAGLYVQVLPSTLQLNLNSANSFTQYGSFSFRITVFNDFRSIFYYGRIVGIPKRTAYRDPTTPNHDLSSCNDVVYPFYWGSTSYGVTANDFQLDQWGNHMMAGQGKLIPFAFATAYPNGFIYLGDQRGNPYWNLALNNQYSQSQSSTCIGIYQFSYFVYASCIMYSEEYTNIAVVPVIVKVLHANGQLMYAKRLPVDRIDPTINKMWHMTVQGSDVIAFQYYQSYRGGFLKRNIAVTRFTESTNNIVYYKFHNFDVGSNGFRIFSDLSTGSFYQFIHNAAAGETIFQGKLSDGSITRKSQPGQKQIEE